MDDIEKIFTRSKDKNKFNFAVKVKAGAKHDDIDGLICIDDVWHLKLTIKAVPENGKANKAIIDFLSKQWSVPKKSIEIIKGAASNYKLLSISF